MISSKVTSPTKDSGSQALLIGVSNSAVMYTTYTVTGGGLDPFYVLSHACYRAIDHDTDTSFDYIYIYLLFPPVGSLIALIVHRCILLPGAINYCRDKQENGEAIGTRKAIGARMAVGAGETVGGETIQPTMAKWVWF